MLKIIKEIYGDKLNQAYSKEGLFVEESIVLKIAYNILSKEIDKLGIDDYRLFRTSDMLKKVQCGVLKIYDNYDEIELKDGCIVYIKASGFFECSAISEEISNKLKDDEECFFDYEIKDDEECFLKDGFEILVLSPKTPLIKSKISNKNNLKPSTKEELKELVNDESIYLGDIDTSLITDMSGLFYGSLRTDFSGINKWDTSKVVNMSGMFFGCYALAKELSFDTSCVVDMSFMFAESNFNNKLLFNTSNVKDMKGMFALNHNFNQKLDFDTSNAIDMSFMFTGCFNFNQKLNFNTSNVTNMESMFYGCFSFNEELNFDTKNVKSMHRMFADCIKFNQSLAFDTSNVTNMDYMFSGCDSLETLPKFYVDFIENK